MALSRRKFLTTSILSTATLATAGHVGAQEISKDIKWNKTCSLLIIGTGFAGLAAALESHYIGLKDVLVIDKMPIPGGNSVVNGGGVAAAGTDMQKEAGIKDNAELLYNDILRAGGGLAHPALARRIADESVSNYKWLKDEVGVKFKAVYFHGGHSVPRSHQVVENSGAGYIIPMLKKCKEFGIPVQLKTKVIQLITNDKGCVVGVKAIKDYKFGDENSGTIEYIRATNGVLIASGGFSRNVKMRESHDPRLDKRFGSTNQPGATGEMIQMAQRIGANTIHMDWIQLGPWTSPDEDGFGNAPLFVEASVGYGPMVDIKTGKRFVQETGNRKVRADAIVAMGHPALIYNSEANVKKKVLGVNMTQEQFDKAIKDGVIRKFNTIKEIADYYKIPAKALEAENELFNKYIRDKKDPQFYCMFFPDSQENNKGPFYACRLWPRVHHTMGGLEINDKAEVLSVSGEPIKGLYAAGEATGGVHGMVRLGTVAVADCMIFGRTAARTAKKFGGC